MNIATALPSSQALIALEPEMLSGILLELVHLGVSGNGYRFCLTNFEYGLVYGDGPPWSRYDQHLVSRSLAEAIAWLKRAGLVIEDWSQPPASSWLALTRRGEQIRDRSALATFRRGSLLPTELIDEKILVAVQPSFWKGDYDLAVVAAFRVVEIAVQKSCRLPEPIVGVALMRKAFNPESGPLTDQNQPAAERDGIAALFAGAFGAGRNPVNHRDMELSPAESVRLIILASHLLSIVAKQTAAP